MTLRAVQKKQREPKSSYIETDHTPWSMKPEKKQQTSFCVMSRENGTSFLSWLRSPNLHNRLKVMFPYSHSQYYFRKSHHIWKSSNCICSFRFFLSRAARHKILLSKCLDFLKHYFSFLMWNKSPLFCSHLEFIPPARFLYTAPACPSPIQLWASHLLLQFQDKDCLEHPPQPLPVQEFKLSQTASAPRTEESTTSSMLCLGLAAPQHNSERRLARTPICPKKLSILESCRALNIT